MAVMKIWVGSSNVRYFTFFSFYFLLYFRYFTLLYLVAIAFLP